MRHFKELRKAIDLERKAQRDAAISEIRSMSGRERERIGRAILNLRGRYGGRDLGGFHVVKFGRSKPIDTEIDVGDVVLISKGDPLRSDLTGTVISKTSRSVSVAFQEFPPKWALSSGIRIDLFFNDVTFKRMENAIDRLENDEKLERLRSLVLGVREPSRPHRSDVEFVDTQLNDYQKASVELALGSEDIFLVHGPPGTGKTRTLTEIAVQLVRSGFRVAASADSNTVADNLLENLIDRGVKAVRIGHPARVEEKLRTRTLSYLVRSDPAYSFVEKLYEEAREYIEKRDRALKPVPALRRGLSDEEIKRYAALGRRVRGIDPSTLKKMSEWIELNDKVSSLMKRARDEEEKIAKYILDSAQVVVGTNSSFGMDVLDGIEFDVLILDEATQATEPSCYIPMVKAKRWIMAGDHRQLPPTVVSLEAQELLSKTLFERWIERWPHVSTLLRIQYRMNEKIMRFPSEMFYDGLLIAHESVKNRTLSSLGYSLRSPDTLGVLDPEEPLVLLDTSKQPDRHESKRPGSTSRENRLEAKIVVKIVEGFLEMGIPRGDIGVITPYDDQVDLISELLNKKVKVSTVDGFQGREKEIIVISFVRSNPHGELGFLEDLRRLNVSLTRARSKLVIVGDFSTLGKHPVYSALRKYVKENGKVVLSSLFLHGSPHN